MAHSVNCLAVLSESFFNETNALISAESVSLSCSRFFVLNAKSRFPDLINLIRYKNQLSEGYKETSAAGARKNRGFN